jgi:hypothetical protein
VIIFGSVRFGFYKKKVTKPIKKNRSRFKPTGFSSVWFLGQKPVQTGLARFFSGLARLFLFGFGSVFLVLGL